MPDRLKYAILGSGRWATAMHGILAQHSQCKMIAETRRLPRESESEYRQRMSAALAKAAAQVAWVCIPPTPETLLLAAAAVDNGMHVVVEKPWVWDRAITQQLAAQAKARGVLIGVHYEYCLLEAVEKWHSERNRGVGLEFHGRFTTSRPDRLNLPAFQNLGSHLFAIRDYAVPKAKIATIDCSYNGEDKRIVSLTAEGVTVAEIDFSTNTEPIIQRYIARFEAGTRGAPFPFNLDFASQIQETHKLFHRDASSP